MLKKTLKIISILGIGAIAVTALIRSNLLPDIKGKFHEYDIEFEKKNCIKRRLRIIADIMQKRITETECRLMEENRQKKQEEYDKMNWDDEKISRKDL